MPRPRFTVPAADKIVNHATDTDPSSVAEWIAQLPYADPAKVTRAILRALNLLNRHPAKVSTRADLMACYRIPCARLMRATPKLSLAPSDEELRQLMIEMSYGYKHLVNDMLGQRSRLQNSKRLTRFIDFAVKYLSLELFLSLESYQCSGSNSWREMLALYRLAEEQNLHHEAVDDRDAALPETATISHVLKRILLLKLLDPCHMLAGEARACFDYFSTRTADALLENLDQTNNQLAGRYLLDLEGLEEPRAPDPDTLPQNPERFRYLNLLPISRQAQHQLRQMELKGEDPPEGLRNLRDLDPAELLKRILKSWHGRQERRNEREETFGWMLCGCGLGTVNHFLDDHQQTARASDEDADEEVDFATISSLDGKPGRYDRVRCRQVNRSVSGICIRLQLPNEADPQVGQVLMLEEMLLDQPSEWYAGIVRRRLRVDADTLEAGVQFIRGEIKPIFIKQRGGKAGRAQPGLWVERGERRMNSILTVRGMYHRGMEMQLQGSAPAELIEADQLVESTPHFDRFRFRIIAP